MDPPITSKAAILWALGFGRAHGGELRARVKKRTGAALTLPDGTLYPTLEALRQAKLVRAFPRRGGMGTPRDFELTAAGVAALRAALVLFRAFVTPLPPAIAAALAAAPPPPMRRVAKAVPKPPAPAAVAPEPAPPVHEPEPLAPEAPVAPGERWIDPDEE